MNETLLSRIQSRELLVSDPLFTEIHEVKAGNEERIARLNSGYHDPAATRKRIGEITGEPIDPSVTITLPFYTDFGRHIRLGKDIFINTNVIFVDLGGITLEDQVLIGPRVTLATVNHLEDPDKRRGLMVKPIHIKKNAWIGAGAMVLPGVTIGENAIVAANSTVTKDVPANTIVAGSPAKVIRQITTNQDTQA